VKAKRRLAGRPWAVGFLIAFVVAFPWAVDFLIAFVVAKAFSHS